MAESPDREPQSLGRRTRRGLLWTLTSTVGVNAVRVISLPVLGRLLDPVEFGLVAAGLTVVMFAQTVRDIGVGPALVQRKHITPQHIETGFAFATLMGLGLCVLVFASAPIVAWFYQHPDLTPFVRALSVLFLFRGITSVPQALCRRELQFRAVAAIDFISFAVGSGLAILLAATGFGAWSLVLGYLVEAVIAMVAMLIVKRDQLRARFHRGCLRDLLDFGIGNTIADIASYFAYQGDYMVVGNRLGAEPLGFYTRAYDLMRVPSAIFSNLAGWVLFSAFSRIQDDRQRLGRALRHGSFALAVLLMPASAALFVTAPEVIRIVLGEGWQDAVVPFQILSLCMLARTSFRLSANVARAAGDVMLMALCNGMYAVLMIGGALIGSQWGIVGVAASTATACVINFGMFTHFGLRRTDLTWPAFLMIHAEALVAALVALGAVLVTASALRAVHASNVVLVTVTLLAAAVAVVIVACIGYWRRQADWVWLWNSVVGRFARRREAKTIP